MVKFRVIVQVVKRNGHKKKDKIFGGVFLFFEEETKNLIIEKLQRFVPTRYHDINNWEVIVSRCVEIDEKYYMFQCSFQNVYLDKETLEPVTYDKQHIIDGDYYYDYNTDETGAGTYTFINSVYKKSVYDLMEDEGIEYE